MHFYLLVSVNPALPLQVVHRSFPGKQVGGVPASEARLDVEHGHVPPTGGVVVGASIGADGARFVLNELEEGLHVRTQAGHDACPNKGHRLLVACLQSLQQGAVVPAASAQETKSGAVYNTAIHSFFFHLTTGEP